MVTAINIVESKTGIKHSILTLVLQCYLLVWIPVVDSIPALGSGKRISEARMDLTMAASGYEPGLPLRVLQP